MVVKFCVSWCVKMWIQLIKSMFWVFCFTQISYETLLVSYVSYAGCVLEMIAEVKSEDVIRDHDEVCLWVLLALQFIFLEWNGGPEKGRFSKIRTLWRNNEKTMNYKEHRWHELNPGLQYNFLIDWYCGDDVLWVTLIT